MEDEEYLSELLKTIKHIKTYLNQAKLNSICIDNNICPQVEQLKSSIGMGCTDVGRDISRFSAIVHGYELSLMDVSLGDYTPYAVSKGMNKS